MRKQEDRGEQHSSNGTHGDIARLYEEEKGPMGVRSGTLGQGNLLGSCAFANRETTCTIKKLTIANQDVVGTAMVEVVGDLCRNKSIVKAKGCRGPSPVKQIAKGARCAERGESGMLLWQHEFYLVLEQEEMSRRQLAPPKPYLYQALEFWTGVDLPEEEKKGLSRRQLREMWVFGASGVCSCSECQDV